MSVVMHQHKTNGDSKSKIDLSISIGDNVELAYYWKGKSAKHTQILWITLLGVSHQANWPSTVNLYPGGSVLKFNQDSWLIWGQCVVLLKPSR